jgi:transcriptional regulator with XRE-family HTH domain
MTTGELLRSVRERHGLTQKQLATRARTSQAAVSRIERGLVSPSIETLSHLLAMMNEEVVLDAREIDWGHDRTLIRGNLALSVAQRLDQTAAHADFNAALRRAAGRAS